MAVMALLAATGRGQLTEALGKAEEQPFVVFGTLDGRVFSEISATLKQADAPRDVKVYLYETGWDNERRVVAVGSLEKSWVDLPDFSGMKSLTDLFQDFFGKSWREVMVGGDRPFTYHCCWEAYFAVAGLKQSDGPALSSLITQFKDQGVKTYNIIAG